LEFNVEKKLSFHLTLDESEAKALYSLLQKMRAMDGHEITGYIVNEFNVTEDEIDLIDWLDKYMTHSEAYEELKLGEEDEEERE
jgi:hypothetical protein